MNYIQRETTITAIGYLENSQKALKNYVNALLLDREILRKSNELNDWLHLAFKKLDALGMKKEGSEINDRFYSLEVSNAISFKKEYTKLYEYTEKLISDLEKTLD